MIDGEGRGNVHICTLVEQKPGCLVHVDLSDNIIDTYVLSKKRLHFLSTGELVAWAPIRTKFETFALLTEKTRLLTRSAHGRKLLPIGVGVTQNLEALATGFREMSNANSRHLVRLALFNTSTQPSLQFLGI